MERKLRKKIFFILFTFCFVLIANPLSAKSYGNKRLWWKNKEVVNKLDLSENQVKAIDKIYSSHKRQIIIYNKEIDKKTSELKKLIKNPSSTRDQVLELTEEINALESERHKLKVQMLWEIREVLNPGQREQLREIKQQYMKNKTRKSFYLVEEFLYISEFY